MDIVHTSPYIAPETGGPSRSVPELCLALAALNQQVQLVSTYVPDQDAVDTWFRSEQVKTCYVPDKMVAGRWGKSSQFGRELTALLTKMKRPIVHDHGLWLPIHKTTEAVVSASNCPLVVSPRGMLESWSLSYHQIRKKVAWRLYQERILKNVTLFHATSEAEAANIRKLGFTQPIAQIPNGVNIEKAKLRSLGMQEERTRTILFLSRIHAKKGLHNLVAAIELVSAENWQILIAGPDENGHQAEIEQAVNKAGLQDKILFVGPIADADKWDVYQQADLFVLPTFSENFGIVVAEALACGVPVITTTGTPWSELQSHRCGWWVEPSVEALTNAIQTAVNLTDAERHEMGMRGHKLVSDHYTWPKIAVAMLQAYEYALGQSSVRPSHVYVH